MTAPDGFIQFGDGIRLPVTNCTWTFPDSPHLPERAGVDLWNLPDFHAEVAISPEAAARICRSVGMPQMADRIEIAARPDLVELDVQIDGFYGESWPT